MADFESSVLIGMLRAYVDASIKGAGALEGKPCQIDEIIDEAKKHTVVFLWQDNEGTSHTSNMVVNDGADGIDGTNGINGVDGYSPTIVVKTATSDTYILTITDKNGAFDTANLKGAKGDTGLLGSISVNGVAQTITAGSVDLDVASSLITEAQWSTIEALLV